MHKHFRPTLPFSHHTCSLVVSALVAWQHLGHLTSFTMSFPVGTTAVPTGVRDTLCSVQELQVSHWLGVKEFN